MTTPESTDKKYLRRKVLALGWDCKALELPTERAWPDRTLLAPGGRICFVEVKAVGVKHNKDHLERQKRCRDELRALGFLAFQVTGTGGIDKLIHHLITKHGWPSGKAAA